MRSGKSDGQIIKPDINAAQVKGANDQSDISVSKSIIPGFSQELSINGQAEVGAFTDCLDVICCHASIDQL